MAFSSHLPSNISRFYPSGRLDEISSFKVADWKWDFELSLGNKLILSYHVDPGGRTQV